MDNKIETFEGDTFKRPIVKDNKCVDPDTNAVLSHWWHKNNTCYQTCTKNGTPYDNKGRCLCGNEVGDFRCKEREDSGILFRCANPRHRYRNWRTRHIGKNSNKDCGKFQWRDDSGCCSTWSGARKLPGESWKTAAEKSHVCKYGSDNKCLPGKGLCYQVGWRGGSCKEKKKNCIKVDFDKIVDKGYGWNTNSNHAGYYDVQNCGFPADYCRWVGNSGPGGDPKNGRIVGGETDPNKSFWSCKLSGYPQEQEHNQWYTREWQPYEHNGKEKHTSDEASSLERDHNSKTVRAAREERDRLRREKELGERVATGIENRTQFQINELTRREREEQNQRAADAAAANAQTENQNTERNRMEFNSLKAGFENQIEDANMFKDQALAGLAAADQALTAAENSRMQQAAEAAQKARRELADAVTLAKQRGVALDADQKARLEEGVRNAEEAVRQAKADAAAERKKRQQVRDELRQQNWEKRHNVIDVNLENHKWSIEMITNKIDDINKNIELLMTDVNNIVDIGTCPDGWTYKDEQCHEIHSGNAPNLEECPDEEERIMSFTERDDKLEWAKRCRVNFLNKVKLENDGDRAPTKFDTIVQQLYLINKIKKLLILKNNLLKLAEQKYSKQTTSLQDKRVHLQKSNIIVRNQEKEIDRNKTKISNLDSDISTLNKQFMINHNEFKEKSFRVFVLKNVFILLLFLMLFLLLMKNNNISLLNGMISSGLVICVISVILGYNFFVYKNRDINRFNKKYWSKPEVPK